MEEKIRLSLADKKILSLMEYNPRISFRELASSCHLSKDTIKYRINRLEKEKIILRYTSFVDYKKLGNQSYKLFLKLNASKKQKEEFKDFLRKQKNVFAIFELNGNWNFSIALFSKSHEDYSRIENSILEQFGDIISNRSFCSMVDAHMFKKNFFELKKSKSIDVYSLWGDVKDYQLDELNKKLIRFVHENARISIVDLSEKLGLSFDATKKRIAKLEENKIHACYKTIINYELLGFDNYKMLIFPKIYSDNSEQKIIDFLKQNPNCINAIRTIGPWRIEAEFLIDKTNKLDMIIDNLNEMFKENIMDLQIFLLRNEEIFACKELLLE